MLLVLVTGWAVWNEEATRRPWKQYQLEFNRLEYQRASEELSREKAKLEAPGVQAVLTRLRRDLAAAQARVDGPEYTKARERLATLEAEYDAANLKAQFSKSELDEALYWVGHAIRQKQDARGPRARAAEIEKQLRDIKPRVDMLGAEAEKARKELKRLRSDVDAIQAKLEEFTAPIIALERREAAIKTRSAEVKQIVLEGLAVNEFKEPISTVDRCITCHLGIDRPGFELAKQPFRSHPNREAWFGDHPIARVGCTACHQGQGPALEVDAAHGNVGHWERPLLRGDLIQASCRKCHVEQRQIARAPGYSWGRMLAEDHGCSGCHTIPGFEHVQKVGPDLTRIAAKVDPGWLFRWIRDPRQYLPKTKMPNFGLSDGDVLSIVAYLVRASQPLPELQGGFKAGSSVERGREIVGKVGCLGCHRIAGMEPAVAPFPIPSPESSIPSAPAGAQSEEGRIGRKPENGKAVGSHNPPTRPGSHKALASPLPAENQDFAPDLSLIASKVSPDWLFSWLKDPKRFRPTTRMPDLRLSDEEARAVTTFLMTLGRKQPIGRLQEELKKAERIAAGERLIRRHGCFGCHDIKGFETAERMAPDLSDFGQKRLPDLFFGEAVQVKQAWEDYTFWKLKNPRIYATAQVDQLMPNSNLSDQQAKAMTVFLKSLTIERVQPLFQRGLSGEDLAVQKGRAVVKRYNCNGCHVIEGEGGAIAAFYADKTRIPPPLEVGGMHEGEKVQGTWLYQFLGQPVPLRPWLDVRMPTFGLSIEEATALTAYFAVMGEQRFPYEYIALDRPTPELLQAGRLLMSKEFFDCFSCHQQGEKKPEGPPEGWSPDLALAKRRLRPLWIAKWLKSPQKIQPGTKMPSYFPGGPLGILEGNEDRQMQAITDYLMHLGGG